MTTVTRQRLALGLGLAAALTVAVTLIAAAHDGGYVYLRLLAHPILGALLACVALIVAVQLVVTRADLRVGLYVLLGCVAAIALMAGIFAVVVKDTFGETRVSEVATSPGFKLVSYESPSFLTSGAILLRLQSRKGLASREGKTDLACFISPRSGAGPQWLFDRASFTGDNEVTVIAKDGTAFRIGFDPGTLMPDVHLDRCSGAPDWRAD